MSDARPCLGSSRIELGMLSMSPQKTKRYVGHRMPNQLDALDHMFVLKKMDAIHEHYRQMKKHAMEMRKALVGVDAPDFFSTL